MDGLSEIRTRCEAFEDSNDSYKDVRPKYILPVLADDGYSRNWAEIAAHSHEDIPYLLGLLEEAEVENRWIPVGERLPEKPYGCLVIVEQDDYWGEPREVMYPHFAGYDGEQWNDGDGEKIPLEVTHWMPLPAPPKGE